jgi:hypothetical protein
VRAGVGLGIVVGASTGDRGPGAIAGNPTFHLDVGAQIDPRFALYVRWEIGSLLFLNQAALFAIAEWHARPWLVLATGAGADLMVTSLADSTAEWLGVAVPVIVGFEFARRPGHALRLELEASAGYQPMTPAAWGYHGALAFGWTWF